MMMKYVPKYITSTPTIPKNFTKYINICLFIQTGSTWIIWKTWGKSKVSLTPLTAVHMVMQITQQKKNSLSRIALSFFFCLRL